MFLYRILFRTVTLMLGFAALKWGMEHFASDLMAELEQQIALLTTP